MKRKTWQRACSVFLCVLLFCSGSFVVNAENSDFPIGTKITLGNYNGEPISWVCVLNDDNGPLFLSEKVLCKKEFDAAGESAEYHTDGWGYIRKQYGSSCWEDSNIREWLNSAGRVNYTHCHPSYEEENGFLTGFTTEELYAIKEVVHQVNVNIWENRREGYCEGGKSDRFNPFTEPFDYSELYHKKVSDKVMLLDYIQVNRIWNENKNYLLSDENYFLACVGGNDYACFEHVYTTNGNSCNSTTRAYTQNGIRPAIYVDIDALSDFYPEKIDTDGDGLFDVWELEGLDCDGDGTIDLDLPAMGANPNIPDIFVEVDWMVRPQKKFLWWETQASRSMAPSTAAMRLVYDSFKQHGINLHIDVGPDSTDFVTGKKWGKLSGGNEIPYEKNFNISSSWGNTVNSNFSKSRYNVFKHCLFINQLDGTTRSGKANDAPGQFFIVANQDWVYNGGAISVGGTFMHELGHTLGLLHGGCDNENHKPNYLSVMNYAFQTTGLVGTGMIGYSDYKLPDIDESHINENSGVDPSGLTEGTRLGTTLFYKTTNQRNVSPISRVAIDFNNNGTMENDVSFDLNPGGNVYDKPIATLKSYEDWSGIIYNGGEIGKQNSFSNSYLDGISFSIKDEGLQEKTLEESLNTSTLATEGTGYIELLPSSLIADMRDQFLEFKVENMSAKATTFTVKIQCKSLIDDYTKAVTVVGSKDKIENEHIFVPITKDISSGEYTITCSITAGDRTNNYSFTKEAVTVSEDDIEEMKQLLYKDDELTDGEVKKIESLIEKYENAKSANACKLCGKDHGTSFFGKVTAFFHKIAYFFAHLFVGM